LQFQQNFSGIFRKLNLFFAKGAENPAGVHRFLCKLAEKGPAAKEAARLM